VKIARLRSNQARKLCGKGRAALKAGPASVDALAAPGLLAVAGWWEAFLSLDGASTATLFIEGLPLLQQLLGLDLASGVQPQLQFQTDLVNHIHAKSLVNDVA
jgi:hypothetical protein